MNDKDLQIVERFKELVSMKVKIHELKVFGSRARGDASPESDLDVLVVVEQLDHTIERYNVCQRGRKDYKQKISGTL